jgi:mannosyltransferase
MSAPSRVRTEPDEQQGLSIKEDSSDDAGLRHPRVRGFWWFVAGLTVVAVVLAVYRIGHDSLWTDEAASVRIARSGWPDLWTVDHGNMSLYYLLLKAWLVVASGDAAIRVLSTVPFVLTVPCVALLGRRTSGDKVALLAAALVSTHPVLVRYGQEARGYSLAALLVTAAVLFLTVGLQNARRSSFLAGVALLGVGAYAHPVAALTGAVVVGWLCTARRDALPASRLWIIGLFGVVLAPLALELARAGSQQISWAQHSNNPVRAFASVTWHVAGDTLGAVIVVGLALVSCCYTLVSLRGRAKTRDASWLVSGLVPVWVVGTGVAVLIVLPKQSLLVDRYLLLIAPGVALLASAGAFAIGPWKIGVALLGAIVVINAAVVVERGAHYRTDEWRAAQRFVATRAQPGDGAIFAPTAKVLPFEYYQLEHHDTAPTSVLPPGSWGDTTVFNHLDKSGDVATVAHTIGAHPRIWVLIGRGPGGGPSPAFLNAIRKAVAAGHTQSGTWHFGRVEVDLYE